MEWRSPSNWAESPAKEHAITSALSPHKHAMSTTASHNTGAAAVYTLPAVTTGEAMDVVAAQCERRGLTNAVTWLSEMSLHAVPSVLLTPVPPTSTLALVVRGVDKSVASSTSSSSTSAAHNATLLPTGLSPHFQRLHRMALGYFAKGEFQRCHQSILREVMRNSGTGSEDTLSDTEGEQGTPLDGCDDALQSQSPSAAVALSSSLPSPAVVRGFRTTTLPPVLQFLSLYALFMDGMKAKQLSNNANAGSGGLQRAVHPHARVLRAYLLEAMRNPINTLPSCASIGGADALNSDAVSPPRISSGGSALYHIGNGNSGGQSDAVPLPPTGQFDHVVTEGWDPQTPSGKKQPWTTMSASRGVPGVKGTSATAFAGGTAAASAIKNADSGSTVSSVGSHAFSNFSPGTNVRNPPCTPDAAANASVTGHGASPLPGISNTTANATAANGDVAAMDLLHMDPYLTWLMGVVLRELRMRQECATFLLAAVTVNPLLRCAWEDLTSLVSREAQLAELDAALDGVEPYFMADIFAAEVRGLLGVTPVSSLRLRGAAAAVAAAGAGAGKRGEDGPVSAASRHAVNRAKGFSVSTTNEGGVSGMSPTEDVTSFNNTNTSAVAGIVPLSPNNNNNANPNDSSSPSAAALTNAWECLNVLFPDTPSLLSQLAHFYYHQRNRLDKAEALYQKIRKLDPHCYGILYDYSNVLYTKRDRLGLSSLVQSVYHADAFRAETNFAVGNYYVLLGQHDRAALHFHRTTAIDPQCAEAWLLLGHAYVEVKNTTAAVEAYRTAVELNERDYRGWYNLGQIYELLEAYHHALYYYWHTTALRPADPGMWVAVANCLEHDGRVSESIACLERAETYDVNTSPNYPAYVRRIATHHIANSSFTRACVYLEKLVQSPAATGEDLLLALPFLIQHYVQRARKSMELAARSSSYDPALFSPGMNISPVSSPSSASAGRTALHHTRAAAALQQLRKAEEHLEAMAELVMPAGTAVTSSNGDAPQQQHQMGKGNESEAVPMAGLENLADGSSAEGRRRGKHRAGGSASYRANITAANVEELPPVAFVRSRHHEISALRNQVMQLLHPPTQQQQQQPNGPMPASSSAAGAAGQGQQRGFFAHTVGRR